MYRAASHNTAKNSKENVIENAWHDENEIRLYGSFEIFILVIDFSANLESDVISISHFRCKNMGRFSIS